MDVSITRPSQPLFGDGGAAGGEQDRHVRTRRVHNRAHRVGGTDDDMHHDGLRPTGDAVEAISHADGDILVRDRNGLGGIASL